MQGLARNVKIEKLHAWPDGTPVGTRGRVDKIDNKIGMFSVDWDDDSFSIEDMNEHGSSWKIIEEN